MNTQTLRDGIQAALKVEMSLPDDKTKWSYEQRVAYNKEFAKRIIDLGTSAGFTGTEIAVAERVKSQPFAPLEDTSFDWGMFGNEILNQAEDINPFSERNRSQTGLMIFAGIVIIGLAYVYVNRKTVA